MNTLHISAVYDAFSNTHSNIAFQNEVSWGGTLSSYKINILGREQNELFGGVGMYQQLSAIVPTFEKDTYPKDPAVSPETNHAYVCFSTMTLLYTDIA